MRGGLAVAEGAQNGGSEVVGGDDQCAGEHGDQIRQRPVEDVVRCFQQHQHGARHQQADGGKQDSHGRAQHHRHGDRLFEPLPVACAELLGDQDGKALGHRLNSPQHQPINPVAGAQGGQGLHPHPLADDDGVHDHIQLLSQIAQNQREGEGGDQLCGTADSHILDAAHDEAPLFSE